MRVLYYRLAFNKDGKFGNIQIFLANEQRVDFTRLDPSVFNALCNILKESPVYWNGRYLTTVEEPVREEE